MIKQKFEMIFCLKEILTTIIAPQKINIIVLMELWLKNFGQSIEFYIWSNFALHVVSASV